MGPAGDEDAPLDPALERVRRKLARLMLIAGLTLGLGIAAVLAAMIYRIAMTGDREVPAGSAVTAPLPGGAPSAPAAIDLAANGVPEDARLASTSLEGGHMLLAYEDREGTTVLVVRLADMTVVGRVRLTRGKQ